MSDINIEKVEENIEVYYDNSKILLPEEYSNKVEEYWNDLIRKGKKFFRGDCYTIEDIEKSKESIRINVKLTDYAHYLYTVHRSFSTELDCRVISTSALIETLDGRLVLGEMNSNTAAPGKLQFTGGGIDKEDIIGDCIDLRGNIKKEIFEELGIDTNNEKFVKSLEPSYLVSGGKHNFLSLVFKINLLISEKEVLDIFNSHNDILKSKQIIPEFNSLAFIHKNKTSIEEFIINDLRDKSDNIIPVLRAI